MAYWIFDNGETVGPLRGNEVLDRAKPDTLISHGEQWLRFDEHPDFAHLVDFVSSQAAPSPPTTTLERKAADPIEARDRIDVVASDERNLYWTWIRGSGPPIGPLTRDEVLAQGGNELTVRYGETWVKIPDHPDFRTTEKPENKNVWTRRRAIGLFAGLAIVASALVVIVYGLRTLGPDDSAVPSAPISAENSQPELKPSTAGQSHGDSESTEAIWAYSEPFNTIPLATRFSHFDEGEIVASSREILEEEVSDGEIDRIDGYTAWVDLQQWQDWGRKTQNAMLMNVAVNHCGCLDPADWKAEFRSASDELLASSSPNGLRALWTPQGVLPERLAASGDVDTSSPMAEDERVDALTKQLELAKLMLRYDGETRRNDMIRQRLENEIRDLSPTAIEDQPDFTQQTETSPADVEPLPTPKLTTDDVGNTFLPGGGSVSSEVPAWVPEYVGSNPKDFNLMKVGASLSGGFKFETADGAGEVLEYYESSLQATGFEVIVNKFARGKKEGGFVDGHKKSTGSQVKVFVTSEGGATTAEVSFSRK